MSKSKFIEISNMLKNGKTAILYNKSNKWVVNWNHNENNFNQFIGSIININDDNDVFQRIFLNRNYFWNAIRNMAKNKNLNVLQNYSFVTNYDTFVKEYHKS